MIYLIIALWYLIGSIGGMYISYKIYKEITIGDVVIYLTVGGISGLFTILYELTHTDLWDKKIF